MFGTLVIYRLLFFPCMKNVAVSVCSGISPSVCLNSAGAAHFVVAHQCEVKQSLDKSAEQKVCSNFSNWAKTKSARETDGAVRTTVQCR